MTPQAIGRYTVLRELGRGAMGIVYEAEDPNIGRTVALKVVRADQIGANRDDVMRRFKNEARAAGNLNHPNIITIYDAGDHDGLLYIAMERVSGATLADLIVKQGRMPAERVVDIIRQVCLGLNFAHTHGIVHRDVKPANILISDSLVKISDFGIANVGDGMTLTGTVIGTPNYMSPEQVLGKPLDGRSDLFSVGVMLYEMVTGEKPFEGQSITTIMYKIVHEEPIAPRKLDSSIAPGLSAIVERALAKAPEARFQSGAEMAAALQNYKQSEAATLTLSAAPAFGTSPLPEAASLSTAQAATYPTTQAAPPSTLSPPAPQPASAPPEKKKRGLASIFVMGCFAVVIAGILAITIIAVVATRTDKSRKTPAVSSNDEPQDSTQPGAPGAPEPATPPSPPPSSVNQISPPVASKTRATIKIDSDPPGAQVVVDGKQIGKQTPATLTVDRGQHNVAVRLPGFQAASAKFKVNGGEEFEFSPQLVPEMPNVKIPNVVVPGVDLSGLENLQKLHRGNSGLTDQQKANVDSWQQWGEMQRAGKLGMLVHSRPTGAEIWVDGNDTGKKTPAVLPSTEGTHVIRLELAGHQPYEKNVKVAVGRPSIINAPLEPAPSTPQ